MNLTSKLKKAKNNATDIVEINFEATDRDIITLWAVGILPPKVITLKLGQKDRILQGIQVQCEKVRDKIQHFLTQRKSFSVSNQLTYNQILYTKKMHQCDIFQKSKIMSVFDAIQRQFQLASFRDLAKKISCSKFFYLVNTDKEQSQKIKTFITILIDQNINPDRNMIKDKKPIPAYISKCLDAESCQKKASQSQSDQLQQQSSSSEQDCPNYYTMNYQKEKQKNQVKPKTKQQQKATQQIQHTQRRIREFIFYQQLQFNDKDMATFKNWVRKNPHLHLRDFEFSTDYKKRLHIIRLDNDGDVDAKLKQINLYCSFEQIVNLSSFSKKNIDIIVNKFENQGPSYKCTLVTGYAKPELADDQIHALIKSKSFKRQDKSEKFYVLVINGFKPKVQSIVYQIKKQIRKYPLEPLKIILQIDIKQLTEYFKYEKVQNIMKYEVLKRLNAEPEVDAIHQITFNDKLMVTIAVSHQYGKIQFQQSSRKKIQDKLNKIKILHPTQFATNSIDLNLRQEYCLLPDCKDQSKLVMIATENDYKSNIQEVVALLQTKFQQKITFQKKQLIGIKYIVKKINSYSIQIKEDQNYIFISGNKNTVSELKQQLEKQIAQIPSLIHRSSMVITCLQERYLKENQENYKKDIGQQYNTWFQFEQSQQLGYQTSSQINIWHIGDQNFLKTQQYFRNLLQKKIVTEVIKLGNKDYQKYGQKIKNIQIEIEGISIQLNIQFLIIKSFNKILLSLAVNTIRDIIKVPQKIEFPQSWQKQKKDIQIFEVFQNSDQFTKISKNFKAGRILKLKRIQNKVLYQKFGKQRNFLQQLNEKNIQTLFLYHGTYKTDPSLIYNNNEEGFNINYTRDKNFLGMGIYFAVQSQYSKSYSHAVNQTIRQMLYCEVLTGDSKKYQKPNSQTRQIKDTQYKDMRRKIRYESNSLYTNNSLIYAVYKSRRAYPHYLIEYEIK